MKNRTSSARLVISKTDALIYATATPPYRKKDTDGEINLDKEVHANKKDIMETVKQKRKDKHRYKRERYQQRYRSRITQMAKDKRHPEPGTLIVVHFACFNLDCATKGVCPVTRTVKERSFTVHITSLPGRTEGTKEGAEGTKKEKKRVRKWRRCVGLC